MQGPEADETGTSPNPFLDYRLTWRLTAPSGGREVAVPGYFAADGRAAESGATRGNRWRAHFVPDQSGRWTWRLEFVQGPGIAVSDDPGEPVAGPHGAGGAFKVAPAALSDDPIRRRGRLTPAGGRYRRFLGDGSWFLKAGAASPETLLAYRDFDGTEARKSSAAPLKT